MDSEPEPDLAIVNGAHTDHKSEHPSTAGLVIEVAVSSKEIDLEKAALYAEARVLEYWLFLPEDQSVRTFRQPVEGRYTEEETLRYGELLKSSAHPGIEVPLSELF